MNFVYFCFCTFNYGLMKLFKRITVGGGLFFFVLIPDLSGQQTSAIWGTTSSGGKYNAGTIFYYPDEMQTIRTVFSFPVENEGKSPYYSRLCPGSNGKIYGLTSEGGRYDKGVLFEYNANTGMISKKVDFGKEAGESPRGSLVEASNGKLYGMACEGGINQCGVIFEFNPANDSFQVKKHFTPSAGKNPYGDLTMAWNGKLYGMTCRGGSAGLGVLFEYDPQADTLVKLLDFDGTTKGSLPTGSLLMGKDSCLYGMTKYGGKYNKGVLFRYNLKDSTFTRLVDFDGIQKGSNPCGNLVQTEDSMMYGLTFMGGTYGNGILFCYSPRADTLIRKINFNGMNGAYPDGSLTILSPAMMMGQTSAGGNNDDGVLFTYNPLNGSLEVKVHFEKQSKGSSPNTLCHVGNGILYGMTMFGGTCDAGILFRIDTTSFSFEKIADFNKAPEGRNVKSSLTLASDRNLYGMASEGGKYNKGTLFRMDPRLKKFVRVADFNGTNGSNPCGGLLQASNGKLYGLTLYGGQYGKGVLFEYDLTSELLTKKIDFDGITTGSNPYGTLVEAANKKFYGITMNGGTYDYGTLFEYDPAGNTLTKKIDFNDVNGSVPAGAPLLPASESSFYGMTREGGNNGLGVIFEFQTNGILIPLYSFDTLSGFYPEGGLVKTNEGKIYGLTTAGGKNEKGTLFEWDAQQNSLTVLYSFMPPFGTEPHGTLIQSQKDFNLYGTASTGGAAESGTLFKYDFNSSSVTAMGSFSGDNGAFPLFSRLNEICDSPVIVSQPHVDTVKTGEEAFFGTGAFGNSLKFQWQIDSTGSGFINLKNDTEYIAVTTPVMRIKNVSEKHYAYKFRCRVTSLCPVDTIYSDTVWIARPNSLPSATTLCGEIYPNPVTETMYIHTCGDLPETITIMTMTGIVKQVIKPSSSVVRIEVRDWPQGVYMINFISNHPCRTIKFIKL